MLWFISAYPRKLKKIQTNLGSAKKTPRPLSFLLSGESWFAKKQRSPSPHLFMLVKLALEIEAVLLWILWQYLCCHFFKLWFGHVLASQNRRGGTYGTVGPNHLLEITLTLIQPGKGGRLCLQYKGTPTNFWTVPLGLLKLSIFLLFFWEFGKQGQAATVIVL